MFREFLSLFFASESFFPSPFKINLILALEKKRNLKLFEAPFAMRSWMNVDRRDLRILYRAVAGAPGAEQSDVDVSSFSHFRPTVMEINQFHE